MENIERLRVVSLVIFVASLVLFLVGFIAPYWYRVEIENIVIIQGLWLVCTPDWNGCHRVTDSGFNLPGELKSCQAMLCLALICYSLGLILYGFWMTRHVTYLRRYGAAGEGYAAMAVTITGGIFNIIGVTIFGVHYDDFTDVPDDNPEWNFLWCYFCATIAGITHTISGSVTLFLARTYRDQLTCQRNPRTNMSIFDNLDTRTNLPVPVSDANNRITAVRSGNIEQYQPPNTHMDQAPPYSNSRQYV